MVRVSPVPLLPTSAVEGRAAGSSGSLGRAGRAAAGGQGSSCTGNSGSQQEATTRDLFHVLLLCFVLSPVFLVYAAGAKSPLFRWFKHSREIGTSQSPCAISTSFSLVCPNTVDCFCAKYRSESNFFRNKVVFLRFDKVTRSNKPAPKIQSKLVIWCILRYHHTRT